MLLGTPPRTSRGLLRVHLGSLGILVRFPKLVPGPFFTPREAHRGPETVSDDAFSVRRHCNFEEKVLRPGLHVRISVPPFERGITQPENVWRFPFSMSPMGRNLRGNLNELFTELFFSGSAAVGAALSNPPTPKGSGVWGTNRAPL